MPRVNIRSAARTAYYTLQAVLSVSIYKSLYNPKPTTTTTTWIAGPSSKLNKLLIPYLAFVMFSPSLSLSLGRLCYVSVLSRSAPFARFVPCFSLLVHLLSSHVYTIFAYLLIFFSFFFFNDEVRKLGVFLKFRS